MFRLFKKSKNPYIIDSVFNLEKYFLNRNTCYIGFDLDFLLYTLPKLKNWNNIFSNHSIVVTTETIQYIYLNKDSKDLFIRYAYNFISEISKVFPFLVIPETQNATVFQEFMTSHNLNLTDRDERCITYFNFFEKQLSPSKSLTIFTSSLTNRVVAEQLCMKNIVYFPKDES